MISRGSFTVPSIPLAEFVSASFAILGYTDTLLKYASDESTPAAGELKLKWYAPKTVFTCEEHIDWGRKFASRIVVNTFYNNKQKLACDKQSPKR